MSARERALAKYGPSVVAAPAPPRQGYDGAHRGDIVRVSARARSLGRRYVVTGVSRLSGGLGWGYDILLVKGRDDQHLGELSYTTSIRPLAPEGRWSGTIAEGARGTVEPITSDAAGTTPAVTLHDAPTGAEGEAQMATVTRKGTKKNTSTKAAAKPAAAKAATTKAAPAAKGTARPKFAPTKAEVTAIAKRLRDGTKMNELKAEFGLSNGQPIRNALREHGFDSKGATNPEGLTARELQAARRASGEEAAPKAKANGGSTAKPAGKAATSRKKATKAAKDPS